MEDFLKTCSEYCTGCGLCHSICGVHFFDDSNGFIVPELSEKDINVCKTICPAAGNALNNYSDGSIWGHVIHSYLGWSTNNDTRFHASSGGVLTSLCCFLLDNQLVDGIIHTKGKEGDVIATTTIVSHSSDEVKSCCGSRYTTSSPLMNIKDLVKKDETYAFVGKPCDVSALRMYCLQSEEEWTKNILFMFSFFCAGQPSKKANIKLINLLGAKDVSDCENLDYRGNGWPGFASLKIKNGVENRIDYETLWMKILGRDTRKICRFCSDGTGEYADISCGDAWYLKSDGKPDLSEHEGRNVIFTRTDIGQSLLEKAVNDGYIESEDFDVERGLLRKIQPYHYTRKAALHTVKLAMKFCGRKFPLYSNNKLKNFEKGFPIQQRLLRFAGTIQRINQKKI